MIASPMFLYVFSLAKSWPATVFDDVRIIENRGTALMYRKILPYLPFRVIALPLGRSVSRPQADAGSGEEKKVMNIQCLNPVLVKNNVRYFAHRIPDNGHYIEKLVLTATPDADDCPKIIGSLVVNYDAFPIIGSLVVNCDAFPIEWIEVDGQYRRCGIGRELWNLAERILGRKLEHSPVTDDGEAFAAAMMKSSAAGKES